MPYFYFQWTDEIAEHLAEHGITPEDFERVVCNPLTLRRSRSSSLPAAFGYTEDGRHVIAIYKNLDAMTIHAVTAHEIGD